MPSVTGRVRRDDQGGSGGRSTVSGLVDLFSVTHNYVTTEGSTPLRPRPEVPFSRSVVLPSRSSRLAVRTPILPGYSFPFEFMHRVRSVVETVSSRRSFRVYGLGPTFLLVRKWGWRLWVSRGGTGAERQRWSWITCVVHRSNWWCKKCPR